MLGILNQPNYIFLNGAGGIVFEFELVNAITDAIVRNGVNGITAANNSHALVNFRCCNKG
jgi:23S rRNA C2498 (ribose-2'-O)-methylase RlmM